LPPPDNDPNSQEIDKLDVQGKIQSSKNADELKKEKERGCKPFFKREQPNKYFIRVSSF